MSEQLKNPRIVLRKEDFRGRSSSLILPTNRNRRISGTSPIFVKESRLRPSTSAFGTTEYGKVSSPKSPKIGIKRTHSLWSLFEESSLR